MPFWGLCPRSPEQRDRRLPGHLQKEQQPCLPQGPGGAPARWDVGQPGPPSSDEREEVLPASRQSPGGEPCLPDGAGELHGAWQVLPEGAAPGACLLIRLPGRAREAGRREVEVLLRGLEAQPWRPLSGSVSKDPPWSQRRPVHRPVCSGLDAAFQRLLQQGLAGNQQCGQPARGGWESQLRALRRGPHVQPPTAGT